MSASISAKTAPPGRAPRTLALDRFLPDFHFHERHALRVRAPAPAVYRAIWEVTLAEMPLVGALFWLRALPALLLGRRYRRTVGDIHRARPTATPILRAALARSFVLLHDQPNQEIVVGTIGRFWQLSGGSLQTPDPAAFLSFQDPSYARAAMDFRLTPSVGTQDTHLSTETRIQIPDPRARRRFAAYWLVVHPGSAAIRLLWLRAIKRRAERDHAGHS